MYVKNIHSNERGIKRKIDNDRQSMILVRNDNARNKLANHTEGSKCVDQFINYKDNKTATMQMHKQQKGKDKAKNPWDQDYLTFQI